MFAPAALLAAMAVWAPLNGGLPVCGGTEAGVYVHAETRAAVDALLPGVGASGYVRALGQGCEVWLSDDLFDQPADIQCGVEAHELGHAVFGFGHSDDPRNVMYPEVTETNEPPACAALRPAQGTRPVPVRVIVRKRCNRRPGARRRCWQAVAFASESTS